MKQNQESEYGHKPIKSGQTGAKVSTVERLQEIRKELKRLREEGINADQENKTEWEEYVDAKTENTMISELEKEYDKLTKPIEENKEVYNNLEELLQELRETVVTISKDGSSYSRRVDYVIKKLQNTIDSQRYIVTGIGDNIQE